MVIGPQDIAVGLVAVVGAIALGRKVWRLVHPAADDAACPNCASGAAACAPRTTPEATGVASPDPTRH